MIGLFQAGSQAMADRFLLVPSDRRLHHDGLGGSRLSENRGTTEKPCLAYYRVQSSRPASSSRGSNCYFWRNSEISFSPCTGGNERIITFAHNNLGIGACSARGEIGDAITHFRICP